MKNKLVTIISLCLLTFSNIYAKDFQALFTDANLWNGKIVPEEEICSDYNFEAGHTPEISLQNIPRYTRKIILSFSDETFQGMKDGGHGIISYTLDIGTQTIIIPSIAGETFDLPDEFTSIIAHKGVNFGKEEGAYLAPCSGGKGNTYSMLIQAVDENNKVLDSVSLTLGRY